MQVHWGCLLCPQFFAQEIGPISELVSYLGLAKWVERPPLMPKVGSLNPGDAYRHFTGLELHLQLWNTAYHSLRQAVRLVD